MSVYVDGWFTREDALRSTRDAAQTETFREIHLTIREISFAQISREGAMKKTKIIPGPTLFGICVAELILELREKFQSFNSHKSLQSMTSTRLEPSFMSMTWFS